MNKSDSERIATILENNGYKPALNINEADLILVNMCSIRQSAVDRVHGLSRKFKTLEAETVLTGCILKKDRKKFKNKFDEIWKGENYFGIKPRCQNKFSAFVPISNGCNNFCSYCVVPFTRGSLICRSHKEILKEVQALVNKGSKKIWLLGQNVNDYHSPANKSVDFVRLLRMLNNLPGKFSIRFMSPHPKNFTDELIQVMAESKKVAKYLHLPVQSGDNGILKKMNRPYTVKQYKTLVKKIRKKMPEINLSTDIIVGFPGETKKQFQNTARLFKEIGFDLAYISKYSPRHGTAAFQLKDSVSLEEKKRREKILRELIKIKKIIVVLGPTASGKSEMAIKIARKFNGEIVSADSRQVYKGMDIGTGKITKQEMAGIPHHLLNVASPKTRFNVSQYRKLAMKSINKIIKRGKTPILCGGTGFYIQAVIDGILIPAVKPDWQLRGKLEKRGTEELFKLLKKLDPRRAKTIDKKNRRRLIRALEIVIKTRRPVPLLKKDPIPYPVLIIGVKKSPEELKKLIRVRLLKWLRKGIIAEVKKLRKSGVSWKRFDELGLEYRYVARYLQNKISYDEMVRQTQKEIERFSKRQITWFNHQFGDFTAQNFPKKNFGEFKQDKRIQWVENQKEAENLVKKFLKK